MYWDEKSDKEEYVVPDDILDLRFRIECPTLPVDHAWELSQQICKILPWFNEEPQAGLHIIHGADSGNGWERPEEPEALLYLSRRTRLGLRIPKKHIEASGVLTNKTINIDGNSMTIGKATARRLSASPTQYSRYIICDKETSEDDFLSWAVDQFKQLELTFNKVLSGKTSNITTPKGDLSVRSLMIAGLSNAHAVRLQEFGIGDERTLGCGIFIPQKEV